MTTRDEADISFLSDEDGELHLTSDDRESVNWTVRYAATGPDGKVGLHATGRLEGEMYISWNYKARLSSWWVPRNYCHLEVHDGVSTWTLGICNHTTVD